MEALTGVNVALLTIYDMCKAIDKGMVISDVHLVKNLVERAEIFTLMNKNSYINQEKNLHNNIPESGNEIC